MTSAVSWYGIALRRTERAFRISDGSDADLAWIGTGDFEIAWPADVSPRLLAHTMTELTTRGDHSYFALGTPLTWGDVVLDVGACEGAFALDCLLHRGAEHVYCFEPDSRMAHALELTAARNNLNPCLTVVSAAVGDMSGAVEFVENALDPLNSRVGSEASLDGQPRVVRQVSLDEWSDEAGIRAVDYLKVDAEGSDLAVLQGAGCLIRRWKPRIAVTAYHHPEHAREIGDYLQSLDLGYVIRVKGLVVFDGVVRPVMVHASVPGERR